MGLYIILFLVLVMISIGMLSFTLDYLNYLNHKKDTAKARPQSDSLIAALKDADPGIRAAAALSLGILNYENGIEPLIEILIDKDPGVRMQSVRALGQISEKCAVIPIIEKLKDEASTVRAESARALELIKDRRALESLIVSLKDEEPAVRVAAIRALEQIPDMCAVEPLMAVLKDEDPAVRVAAIKALSEISDMRAVEPLMAVLKDKDPTVRSEAALTLAIFGDQRAVEPLKAVINDEVWNVRISAELAVAMIKGDNHAENLMHILWAPTKKTEEDWRVPSKDKKAHNPHRKKYERKRSYIPITLGWILIASSFFLLSSSTRSYYIRFIPEQILNLENQALRGDAIKKLANAGPRATEPLMDAFYVTNNEFIRSGIVETLRQISGHSVEFMIALLKDETPAIRAAAAESLGRSMDKRAVEPLIYVLYDKDPGVRDWAAWSLGFIADERAVEPLITKLNDEAPSVRRNAALGLGRIGGKRVVEPLIALLNDPDEFLRVNAAEALTKIGDERAETPMMAAFFRNDYAIIAGESAFFIKRAKAGYEPIFIAALNSFGTVETANYYLNCGNVVLENAAREWAKLKGYEIGSTSNHENRASWGGN